MSFGSEARVLPLFDLEKTYLPLKLSKESKLWYVDLLWILDAPSGGFNFVASLNPPRPSLPHSFGNLVFS